MPDTVLHFYMVFHNWYTVTLLLSIPYVMQCFNWIPSPKVSISFKRAAVSHTPILCNFFSYKPQYDWLLPWLSLKNLLCHPKHFKPQSLANPPAMILLQDFLVRCLTTISRWFLLLWTCLCFNSVPLIW